MNINSEFPENVTPAFVEEPQPHYPNNVEIAESFADENQASEEDAIKELLSNEIIREQALTNAVDIKKKCKGWFTPEQLSRKLMLKPEPVAGLLNLLCLFEMAYRQERKGVLKYTIQLSLDDKLKNKLIELEEAESLVVKLKNEVATLANKIAPN